MIQVKRYKNRKLYAEGKYITLTHILDFINENKKISFVNLRNDGWNNKKLALMAAAAHPEKVDALCFERFLKENDND